ncbi:caspase family protein [Photobacterium carnosum]|uniref:caspase family protein n=1 Tax=Photobacterium carnosum TaxID=2023717 RepID=UPI001E2B9EF2|nr:caspase family protein [Photobacterium carnosum]MCD9513884.1 caspase family protein [Photobacterium carnosum]
MKKALVVGINDYPNAPLNGCVNDANAIVNTLESNGDGSPNFGVKLITSPGDDVTRSTLREAIEQLFNGESDMALLYFSGHGLIKSTGGYLVTKDAKRYDEGVSMDEILNLANKSKAKNKVIILDCCHSGALGTPSLTDNNIAQLSEGLSVLTASRDNEYSLEVNGAGVFTSLLVDALKGGAADLRGNITPGSLYAYVDEALGAWDQRPIFKTNVSSFASLRKISPKIPFETMRKITSYFVSPEAEHKLDPTYEDTEACAVADNVKIFKDLQKFQSVGLVVPVDAEFMYFAAMESKSCRLTALGNQYWRLVKEKKL